MWKESKVTTCSFRRLDTYLGFIQGVVAARPLCGFSRIVTVISVGQAAAVGLRLIDFAACRRAVGASCLVRIRCSVS